MKKSTHSKVTKWIIGLIYEGLQRVVQGEGDY